MIPNGMKQICQSQVMFLMNNLNLVIYSKKQIGDVKQK